jgi:phosphatidylglycerophosphatase A
MKQMLNAKTLKMNVEFFKKQDFGYIFIDEIVGHCNVCKNTFQGLF